MKTEDARNILMLAAVEETDEGGIVLSAKERHEASREAGSPLPANPGRAKEEAFLAVRAAARSRRRACAVGRTTVRGVLVRARV